MVHVGSDLPHSAAIILCVWLLVVMLVVTVPWCRPGHPLNDYTYHCGELDMFGVSSGVCGSEPPEPSPPTVYLSSMMIIQSYLMFGAPVQTGSGPVQAQYQCVQVSLHL